MMMTFFHSIDTCSLETGQKPADSSRDFQPLQRWAMFKAVTQKGKAQSPITNHLKCTVSLNTYNFSTLIKIASLKMYSRALEF